MVWWMTARCFLAQISEHLWIDEPEEGVHAYIWQCKPKYNEAWNDTIILARAIENDTHVLASSSIQKCIPCIIVRNSLLSIKTWGGSELGDLTRMWMPPKSGSSRSANFSSLLCDTLLYLSITVRWPLSSTLKSNWYIATCSLLPYYFQFLNLMRMHTYVLD